MSFKIRYAEIYVMLGYRSLVYTSRTRNCYRSLVYTSRTRNCYLSWDEGVALTFIDILGYLPGLELDAESRLVVFKSEEDAVMLRLASERFENIIRF
jgi:hypothetical protein